MRLVAAPWLALMSLAASAQTVSLSGSMGDKALLVINGTPRTLAAGTSFQNVKVISVAPGEAVVEMDGKRSTLTLGGAQVNLGRGDSEGSGSRIVLTAGSGGHFVTGGSINGKAVSFMVDTGASMVAMSESDAERIGLKYKGGERGIANTANGQVPVYRVNLTTVRVGDVPMPMPNILLGNSFLTRFQMKRENDVLTLERR
jgi:aspartyl protease family protein